MKIRPFFTLIALCLLLTSWSGRTLAHQASVTYVANEAILIVNGDKKVLFDPFFHQAFGTYQLVPKQTKEAIFAGKAPFDNLTAIVISHAHGDHFAAAEVLKYLQRYTDTFLVAPQQAIDELSQLPKGDTVKKQLVNVKLEFNHPPKKLKVAGLVIDAVRIPHAGWPGRAEIENIVFRVTLPDSVSPLTIMHMGDADPDDAHYLPYKAHWQSVQTDTAFPPYWFYFSAEGKDILSEIINAKHSIGIHVPVVTPKQLKNGGDQYFSVPGEVRNIGKGHSH